jgi:type IV pilus assembly protein PilF
MSRTWRPLAAPTAGAMAVMLLAGCVSSSTGESGRKTSETDASRANTQLGVAYMQQGNLKLAKEKLDRAEKQNPRNYEVHWAQASLAERMNQPAAAEEYYQTAARLAPGNPELGNTYAVFLCKNGKVDKALPLFDSVIRNPLYRTPWAVATNAAVCLRADKRGADAVPYLERAIAQRPDFVPAVVELGDLKVSLGKPEEARVVVDTFLSIGRKSPDALLVGVRAAIAQGNRPAADNYARLLRRDFPNTPQSSALPQILGGAKSSP